MTKGCGGEWRLGRSSKCNSVILSHKTSPNSVRAEHTKSYKTFGGKLVSSKVEDKENGEFHHEVIITVQLHSAPAHRCLHGKDTLARHGGLQKYQRVSKQ
ncbi:hypothetical protein ATANTOWER_018931 [Ataeniobius toweri]|uniref:Uncharacterized protein n=1 Tax=Ataeniobius toweri TaxID=208326 RepID=A0ABU7B4T1_9TELE|nr:hypothetical protein [Ataeniobius toweri]